MYLFCIYCCLFLLEIDLILVFMGEMVIFYNLLEIDGFFFKINEDFF